MPGGAMPLDSDSEDELPPAWEERATAGGYVYYVNHQQKITQWTHPRTGKSKRVTGDLPAGWEKKVDPENGKIVFVDHNTNRQTLTDPRLAFAVEETPNFVSEIRQRFDASTKALEILHGRDLSGKVAIITGANAGIGFETARSLAFHQCEVVFACRNEKATLEAIEKIYNERETTKGKCKYLHLDLSSLKSVQQFIAEVHRLYTHIDMLILNAGIMGIPHTLTEDGFETLFQVCHLSHFYLTTSMEDLLDQESRVVVLSSESHRFSKLPEDLTVQMLNPPASKYWGMIAYNDAKLCNTLFGLELSRRWQKKGICVYTVHPGNMVTSKLASNWWFYRLIFTIVRPFTKSLQQAASTTIFCATAPELTAVTGYYFNNCFFTPPSDKAQNTKMAENLWRISEDLITSFLQGEKH